MTKSINARSQKLSQKFYDQYLANSPVAGQDHGPVEGESYWQPPQHGGFSIVNIDVEDFRAELKRYWAHDAKLESLIEPLYRLSQSIEEASETETEISPFIYAMF